MVCFVIITIYIRDKGCNIDRQVCSEEDEEETFLVAKIKLLLSPCTLCHVSKLY